MHSSDLLNSQELIIKLLNLSNSDNNNEALVAIRKANAIIQNNRSSWEEFFKPKKRASSDRFQCKDHDKITSVFLDIHEFEGDETSDFVKSVYKFYMKNDYITFKQLEAIEEYLERLKS